MNQKLIDVLLGLATEPLKTVQDQLQTVANKSAPPLVPWERTFVANIQKALNITSVFKYLFIAISEDERENISNQLIKPIFLGQAKIPHAQRDKDFYTSVNQLARQHGWESANDYLSNVLTQIDDSELTIILSNASSDESLLILNYLYKQPKENFKPFLETLPVSIWSQLTSEHFLKMPWLEKLPVAGWDALLSQLALEELGKKIDLLDIGKKSKPLCKSLANYLINAGPNQEKLWKFVQEKQLLTLIPLIKSLATNTTPSESFNNFFATFIQYKKNPNELWSQVFQPLLDPPKKPLLKTLNLYEQMVCYGLLAIYLGQSKIAIKNARTTQDFEAHEKTLNDYKAHSPFLAALFNAKVFPDTMVQDWFSIQLALPTGTIKGYLQLAGQLPRGKEAEQLEQKSRVTQSSSSTSSRVAAPINHAPQNPQGRNVALNIIENALDEALVQAAIQASLDDINNVGQLPASTETNFEFDDHIVENRQIEPQRKFRSLNPSITGFIFGVLSLILVLILCFIPAISAPLWLIPIAVFGGMLGGALFAIMFNRYHRLSDNNFISLNTSDHSQTGFTSIPPERHNVNQAALGYNQGSVWGEWEEPEGTNPDSRVNYVPSPSPEDH